MDLQAPSTARKPTNGQPLPAPPVVDDGKGSPPPPSPPGQEETHPPRWVLPLELGYLGALAALMLLYIHVAGMRSFLPDPIGPIPLGVLWFGALGGVAISLTGIVVHAQDWKPAYDAWHIMRPFLGAIMGGVGFLIFIVVVRAAGTSNIPATSAVFYLVAFLIGYREGVFRTLISKATDMLLSPGKVDDTAPAESPGGPKPVAGPPPPGE